jgi:uncharacterized protein
VTVEERNKQQVREFFAILNRGDVPALIDAYAAEGCVETMGHTLISGRFTREQIRAAAGQIFAAFPYGLEFSILAMTAEGERVAVEAHSQGRHASGALYDNDYHFLFVFRDGRVVLLREYMDCERVTEVLCGGRRPPQRSP